MFSVCFQVGKKKLLFFCPKSGVHPTNTLTVDHKKTKTTQNCAALQFLHSGGFMPIMEIDREEGSWQNPSHYFHGVHTETLTLFSGNCTEQSEWMCLPGSFRIVFHPESPGINKRWKEHTVQQWGAFSVYL